MLSFGENMMKTGLSKMPVSGWTAETPDWWGYERFRNGQFCSELDIGWADKLSFHMCGKIFLVV